MVTHTVKLDPYYAKAVVIGWKRFELRKNDRNYLVGDRLELLTTLDGVDISVSQEIVYMLTPDMPHADGLQPGYCVLGLDHSIITIPNANQQAA